MCRSNWHGSSTNASKKIGICATSTRLTFAQTSSAYGGRTAWARGHSTVPPPPRPPLLALPAAPYFYPPRPPQLTDKDTIVLADFKNTTGDEVFDETLRR